MNISESLQRLPDKSDVLRVDIPNAGSSAGQLTLNWKTASLAFSIADGLIASAAALITLHFNADLRGPCSVLTAALLALFVTVSCLAGQVLYGREMSVRATRSGLVALDWLQAIGLFVGAVTLWALVVDAWMPGAFGERAAASFNTQIAELLTLGVCGLLAVRVVWTILRRLFPVHVVVTERVLVIGEGDTATTVAAQLRRNRRSGVEVVGVLEGDRATGTCLAENWSHLARAVRDEKVDAVIVAVPWQDHSSIQDFAEAASWLPVMVRLAIDPAMVSLRRRLENSPELLFIPVSDPPLRGGAVLAKRLEDLVLATVALALIAPLILVIIIAIRMDSDGPVLFRQLREGYGGRVFSMLKFRTMRVEYTDFACERQTSRGDSRITRVGSFLRRHSLDELPQLLNVLVGDMSLVGPRPHALSTRTEGTLLHEAVETYVARLRVKPGITGWAQVNGVRGEIESKAKLQQRVTLDIEYIERWSLLLDVQIICRTAFCMVHDDFAF